VKNLGWAAAQLASPTLAVSERRTTRAVIPAAGLGTRFLPATKSQPKEMLPIVDRPAIEYVVEEAHDCGLSDISIISRPEKTSLEGHFAPVPDLVALLTEQGKEDLLAGLRRIDELGSVNFIYQPDPRGLGDAIAHAEHHVGENPFAVLLADDLMVDGGALLTRMLDVHQERQATVLALIEVPDDQISAYGSVAAELVEPGLMQVHHIVEKPSPADAPSNLAVIGRYVFTPGIFAAIGETDLGVGGELQITDAIGTLINSEPVFGVVFSHGRFDVGQKLDFLRATVEIALDRDDLGPEFAQLLVETLKRRGLV
jgi:UTP--glucose-1-phosphate uridylyltransferase